MCNSRRHVVTHRGRIAIAMDRQGAYEEKKWLHRNLVAIQPLSLHAEAEGGVKVLRVCRKGVWKPFKLTKKLAIVYRGRGGSNDSCVGPLFSGFTIPINKENSWVLNPTLDEVVPHLTFEPDPFLFFLKFFAVHIVCYSTPNSLQKNVNEYVVTPVFMYNYTFSLMNV